MPMLTFAHLRCARAGCYLCVVVEQMCKTDNDIPRKKIVKVLSCVLRQLFSNRNDKVKQPRQRTFGPSFVRVFGSGSLWRPAVIGDALS